MSAAAQRVPEDVWVEISHHVDDPRDLASLARVSAIHGAAATPRLYRAVTLRTAKAVSSWIRALQGKDTAFFRSHVRTFVALLCPRGVRGLLVRAHKHGLTAKFALALSSVHSLHAHPSIVRALWTHFPGRLDITYLSLDGSCSLDDRHLECVLFAPLSPLQVRLFAMQTLVIHDWKLAMPAITEFHVNVTGSPALREVVLVVLYEQLECMLYVPQICAFTEAVLRLPSLSSALYVVRHDEPDQIREGTMFGVLSHFRDPRVLVAAVPQHYDAGRSAADTDQIGWWSRLNAVRVHSS
ncbi:hypothetical protein AURDEDRAFT_177442 [Auricularia subglabra TFB-10046 SS5]|uniref:F-box domain-containing protein n=1 Tax=Auricularia subglabra (strain TFB-10046 / SS5) TaxID=717982 RepID=J0LAP4_AURST|nr:hypothetical protein AURDEDRAFT_177442 [Auricularia subglabra TFB-10046 SS5]